MKAERPGVCVRAADAVAFVQAELDSARRVSYERHLTQCAECRAFVDDTRVIVGSLSDPLPVGTSAWQRAWVVAAMMAAASILIVVARSSPTSGAELLPAVSSVGALASSISLDPRAIDWIESGLGADGTWPESSWSGPGAADEVAVHAFALLAFVRCVEQQPDPARLSRVRAAAAWLVDRQDALGWIGWPLTEGHFSHPVATLALVGASRLTADAELTRAARLATRHIADSLRDRGAGGPRGNAGQTVWAVAALEQARLLGWVGDEDIERARARLGPRRVVTPGGSSEKEPVWQLALGRDEELGRRPVHDLYSASLAVLVPTGRDAETRW